MINYIYTMRLVAKVNISYMEAREKEGKSNVRWKEMKRMRIEL